MSTLQIPPHPNVLLLLRYCEEPPALVVEYMEDGGLDRLLMDSSAAAAAAAFLPPTTEVALQLGREVTAAMHHLHSHKVLHGNLAARNLLVRRSGQSFTVKVADFGLSLVKSAPNRNTADKQSPTL